MKFNKIPQDTMNGLQLEAGEILRTFDPATGAEPEDSDIICATTGGVNPTCVPTYSDQGEDIDNVPNNMKELKHLDGWECKLAFTALTTKAEFIKLALGSADIDDVTGAIKPRRDLDQNDFQDLWWVGPKAGGGLVAIKLHYALSTNGLSLQTSKGGKGQIAVELTGHVSITDQDTMPMTFYSTDDEGSIDPDISLSKANMTVKVGESGRLRAITNPEGEEVTWESSNTSVATVSDGTISGVAAGNATITATMTYDDTEYSDSCKVKVVAE